MIFVDTSAWFAYAVPSDPNHQRVSNWFASSREQVVTTDYSVDETLTLLCARGEHRRVLSPVRHERGSEVRNAVAAFVKNAEVYMLKPDTKKYPRMTAKERQQFEQAVVEEQEAKEGNIAAAKAVLPRLMADCEQAVAIVRQLREAREAAGVSLAELEQRTGIRKSVLSRLENSKAPNTTLATLQRYSAAIGKCVAFSLEDGVVN